MRNVVNLGGPDRPAAYQRLAIRAILGRDAFSVNAMVAQCGLKHPKRLSNPCFAGTSGVDFLQSNDVRSVALDQSDRPLQIKTLIATVRTVDIPSH
jgi:hypothetical protein